MGSLKQSLYYEIISILGHCLATPPTGSYLKRQGHCIPCEVYGYIVNLCIDKAKNRLKKHIKNSKSPLLQLSVVLYL